MECKLGRRVYKWKSYFMAVGVEGLENLDLDRKKILNLS